MHGEKNEGRGIIPYIPPRLVIYENKKFKYDETGAIRAIVDVETTENRQTKALVFRLIKLFFSIFVVLLIFHFVRMTFFTYTPEKWVEQPKLRIVIVNNLIKKSSATPGENAFIQTITLNRLSFTDEKHRQKYENMRQVREEGTLLFQTDEEISEILGEPYKTEKTYDDSVLNDTQILENDAEYKQDYDRFTTAYYRAYSTKKHSYSIGIFYYDNIAIGTMCKKDK